MYDTVLLLALMFPSAAPVETPVRPVEDTHHGTTLSDPYRWLEDVKSDETQKWMKAQGAHTRRTLDAVPGRAALLERFKAAEGLTPARVGLVKPTAGGRVFITRRAAGEDLAKLFVRDGWDGDERLLFDPDALKAKTGKPHALSWIAPAPDGRRVAIGVSPQGSEIAELQVLDVATGKPLTDTIPNVAFAGVDWIDAERFVLRKNAAERAAGPAAERWLDSHVWMHRLGTPEKDDVRVFGTGGKQKLAIAPEDLVFVSGSETSPWVIGAKAGARREVGVFVAKKADLGTERLTWRLVFDYADQVGGAEVFGDSLYALTTKGAPNGRLVRVDLAGDGKPVTLYEGTQPVDTFGVSRDALWFRERNGPYERLLRMPLAGGKPVEVTFDAPGSFVPLRQDAFTDPDADGIVVSHGTWTRPDIVFRADAKTTRAIDTKLAPPPKASGVELVADDLVATSHDGTKVPLSVVRAKNAKPDGSGRVLLEGYGSYGNSITPYFDTRDVAWFEAGVSRAYCHVRGGGEFGEAWHKGGFHATKPNTWKDFIACAERLIELGYAKREHLAGVGTSAGGILIGNAIVERPDLFGAAIVNVGVSDTVRAVVASQNGPNHYAEYGDPRTKEGFSWLRANSAYFNAKPDTEFPPTLLVHGVNDPRVDVWQSAKFTARLQAAKGGPALLRVDYDTGHGMGSTASARLGEQADWLAFVLWQTGAKDYQPDGS